MEAKRSRRPLVLLGLVALGMIGALAASVFSRSVTYYLTPTEVISHQGGQIRVSGTVVDDSIRFDAARGVVSFQVTDGETTIAVEHAGPAPDTLKDGAEAVAEGDLRPDGVFQSVKLFAKCPSKFDTKDAQLRNAG
ncbi:MAG TPA: cytochrome c maturation protein CcmE [Acidimicrobiia bacterium]|nr:cytochrome c maturation protein CcmE [Acidimicrobiia bacterium]